MKPNKKKFKKLTFIILAIVLVITISVTIISNAFIKVTEYAVELSDFVGNAKIVVISDLHGKEYGENNCRLLDKISEQSPDAIFVVGDMLDDSEAENGFPETIKLLTSFLEIAPVYLSLGNQEKEYDYDIMLNFIDAITEIGVVALDESFVDCEINGQKVRIGGTMGHAFPFGRTMEEFQNSEEYIFLKKLEKTELPTIVLSHRPDTFIFNGAHTYWSGIDLVISGHTHGGVIRLPLAGGLYAPMQGLFPEYDYGFFMLGEKMKLVITSGLSGYKFIPRFLNLPEICVINLT